MLDNNSEGYVIYHDGNYKEKLNFRSVGDDYNVTGSKAVSGQWDHWTVSYDAGRVTWYRNGTEDAAYNDVNTDLSNSASLYLGYTEHWRSWGFPAYFSGQIDDVRIYNRALSQEEVSELYDLEKPTTTESTFEIVQGTFTWEEARADAEARGGHLAVLDTPAQVAAVYSYLEEVGTWPFLWHRGLGRRDRRHLGLAQRRTPGGFQPKMERRRGPDQQQQQS